MRAKPLMRNHVLTSFHEWRKRATDLRYHLSLVSKAWPKYSIVHIANLELHENMELARTPSIPQFGAQRTPRVGCLRSGNLQIPSHTPFGEPGTPAPTRRPAALCEAAETDASGSTPLGLVVRDLDRLAIGACHRQAAYRDRLAPEGLPSVLDVEDPAR